MCPRPNGLRKKDHEIQMGCGAAAFRYKAEVTPGMVLIEIIQGGLNGGFLKWKIPIGVNS
jgi:hypothetical protein